MTTTTTTPAAIKLAAKIELLAQIANAPLTAADVIDVIGEAMAAAAAESARLLDLIRRADDAMRSGEMEFAAARRRLAEALDTD